MFLNSLKMSTPSAERQKGINSVQQCSVENQKGANHHILCTATAPFLVLNGSSLDSDNALLALIWWRNFLPNIQHSVQFAYQTTCGSGTPSMATSRLSGSPSSTFLSPGISMNLGMEVLWVSWICPIDTWGASLGSTTSSWDGCMWQDTKSYKMCDSIFQVHQWSPGGCFTKMLSALRVMLKVKISKI